MKADYLTLTNGRKVRIEWNWNAVKSWTRSTGKVLADLASLKAGPDDMLSIAYHSAIEGEEADGRELGLTEKEFGRLINMQGIIEFSKILTEQATTEEQKKSKAPPKSPRIFFRNKT
jgi:hypothetical protein